MRPFVVLALNVLIGSVGLWVGGFAGGCLLAALVVADCMAVVAEGRAWAREDAADTVYEPYDWALDGIPIVVDPTMPPGVAELRNGDQVVGRLVSGGREGRAG